MSDVDKQPTEQNVDTGGGSYVQGDANVGADLIGRDKINAERVEINYNFGVTQPDTRASSPATPPDLLCPYRGLEFFDTQHAANYFGRQEMTAKLLAKVQECNFIAVVGPSGSGKSSLVRAGLMVALQKGKIVGSRDWRLETFRPGENPLQALAGTLLKLNPSLSDVDRWTEIEKLAKRLGNGELSIGLVLEQIRGSLPKLVLIVDQFEETFTLCTDESLRTKFLDTLLNAAEKPWLTEIFTLRADFYGRVLEQETFSKRVDEGLVNVLPMTHEERRAAIEQPALQAGRSFESGLVERILDAVEAEPGQLPLLEFALTELWQRQSADGTLTHAAYEEIGEVSGAIAKRADETLRNLPKADQERARTIFTRLVRVAPPDEGSDDTKRRLLLDELDPSLHPLVQKLADARLLVTGSDEQNKSETAEIAHEALIHKWGTLQTWLNSDREFLLWRQRLRGLVENWQSTNKDEGSLLRGATLNEAQSWLAARTNELSQSEQTFIAESQKLAAREQAEREAARQRQLEQERALTESQRLRAEEQQKRAESEQLRAEEQTIAAKNLRRRNQYLQVALALMALAVLIAGYFWSDAREQQQIAQGEVIVRRTAESLAVTREAQANYAAQAEANQRATAEVARSEADAQKATAIAEKERADQQVIVRSTAEALAVTREAQAKNATQAEANQRATAEAARDEAMAQKATAEAETVRADQNAQSAANAQTDTERAARRAQAGEMAARVQADIAQSNYVDDATILLARDAVLKTLRLDQYININADAALVHVVDNASWRKTLSGHTNWVNSATFSPDGKSIVSASVDGTLKLWDSASGNLLHTLSTDRVPINFATFSPDGKTITSASSDGTVRLWSSESGKEFRTIPGNTYDVNFTAFSPDGKTIASASDDHTVKLWDVATGKAVLTLSGHKDRVTSVAFSPDGKIILSASADAAGLGDHTLKLWDALSGKELRTLSGHAQAIHFAVFSPDGKTILSASEDTTLKLWDATSGEEIQTFSGHSDSVRSATFSPDGKTIVSASDDYTLKMWDVKSGKELRTLLGHSHYVRSVAFSPNGKTIVSASSDQTLKLWDAVTGKELRILSGYIDSAAFLPDSKTILFISNTGIVTLWDTSLGKKLRTFSSPKGSISVWHAAFLSDGKTMLSARETGIFNLWDTESGTELRAFSGHSMAINSAAFSPDGKSIVSASYDQTLKVWDAETGKEIRTFSGHTDTVTSAAFSPDGKTVVSASYDQTLKVWNVATGKELRTLSGHTALVSSVAFSPDGRTVVSASWDKTLKVWDAATGKELRTLSGHTALVSSAAFSPDGRTVVSASGDKTLKVWDAATGKELRTLSGHTAAVTSAFFSPDGKWIVSASSDGVRIWVASIEDLLQMAEVRIQRPVHELTEEERKRYGLK